VTFGTGDTLIAFTDGLIERRDEDITEGQDRLRRAVAVMSGGDLDEALARMVEAVRDPSRDEYVAAVAERLS
jgi:serine phosphatase RsbU (regulator of sigma subunit)